MATDETRRTHEPSFRELVAEIDGLRDLANERHLHYGQRFTDLKEWFKGAIESQEKATNAAQSASEKAITKAEASQQQYNVQHNDLTRKMEAQYKEMIPRPEFQRAIEPLSASRSESEGAKWAVGYFRKGIG